MLIHIYINKAQEIIINDVYSIIISIEILFIQHSFI